MIPEVTIPTLFVDPVKAKANIARLTEKAKTLNLIFRPHFKTHQSHEIGQWFREAGVDKITVSSLRMASYFAEAGWKDITVAFPVNILEIERINTLAEHITLNLLVEHEESIQWLQDKLKYPVHLYIAVNAGNNRTGLYPNNLDKALSLRQQIKQSSLTYFAGVLGHAGHTYSATGEAAIRRIHQDSIASLLPMVNTLREDDPNLIFSYGDTPSASTAVSFPGINELRPGNFVFYDLTQTIIGSCTLQDVAIVMACPVVSKQPERQEVILYGGGIHFSKDRVPYQDKLVFGLPVRWTASGWTVIDDGQSYMKKVSQEHGVLRLAQDWFDQINIGDIVGVIPVHSCMAADLMKQYRSLDDHSLISMMTYV